MFEEELKCMIKYFANKKRIEYYKKTFGFKTTKDTLIDDYGKGMFGCSGHIDGYSNSCNTHYLEITNREETKQYGWDYIANQVDLILYGEGYEQLSLF